MKDALWGIQLDLDTLPEIQAKLVQTLDKYSILTHATGSLGDANSSSLTPAYKAAATGPDMSDSASIATAATSTAELMKSIQDLLTQAKTTSTPAAPRPPQAPQQPQII